MRVMCAVGLLAVCACSTPDPIVDAGTDAGTVVDAGVVDSGTIDAGCVLTQATTPTTATSNSGCAVLTRDTSSCRAQRLDAGVSGFWLQFSCRVVLTSDGSTVLAKTDSLPDHLSNYFPDSNACHETYTAAIQNPNSIAAQSLLVHFPLAPTMTAEGMHSAVVGLALDGVALFGNFAAPGDDIFKEAATFDRCGGHPQMTGQYHYHSEPLAISSDDGLLIGALRDGYPMYGRRDADGTFPTLDSYGGHVGLTADSPSAVRYHYHVNQQTSTASTSLGQMQWFLTTGNYRGTPASCASCQ